MQRCKSDLLDTVDASIERRIKSKANFPKEDHGTLLLTEGHKK
jgi:hypothetical protein